MLVLCYSPSLIREIYVSGLSMRKFPELETKDNITISILTNAWNIGQNVNTARSL